MAAESVALPYYNTYGADTWPPASFVDDAAVLRLPDGMAVGRYHLVGAVEQVGDGTVLAQGTLGEVDLAATSGKMLTAGAELDVRMGDSVRLAGYDILSPRRFRVAGRDTPALRAGEYVRLRLHWQGVEPVSENYHAFVHMLDHLRRPLVQQDQLPGPLFQPPRLWDRFTLWPDVYLLRIPDTASSGLYWPAAGMYEFESEARLPVYVDDTGEQGEDVRLPPMKIIGAQAGKPAHRTEHRMADFAEFTGYSLEPEAGEVSAGSPVTITLHFQSRQVTDQDLIRFVQVVGPQGVVAQHDGPPQDGANPTWAWLPGERVRDAVRLEIGADVAPGIYRVFTGMYDAADASRRVPIYDATGNRAPEDWIPLGTLTIGVAEQ